VRNISQVASAIAEGDLRKKIVVDARGEILELKNTINTMVGQLSSFADEVTRVARDVGTEGKLGGQASVEGVRGTWKELTDNVNLMASNLTNQVRDISQVATAIAQGHLSKKITVEVRGELLDLKNTINTMLDQLSSFADEVTRVARDVGVEGILGGQADVPGVSGIWKELTDNVNLMASNLTNQVRDIAQVTTAVANGDLSRKIMVEVKGEILELKSTINTMVDQLRSFADEVTRVAREVGTEGVLGGQAQVRGVSGTWRELTDNVNVMARNLTEQVRGIARVVTAVANGNLREELKLDAKGEIATLVATINNMIITLSTFADQVSGVARDVGVEGKLGGQADVPGAAGIWRDLTNNVNELAGNLTRQVRAIGDVATAVTKGDLTQAIDVEARGEVALLKDNLNQMIGTLAETTRVNRDQDWLKTNLTRFTRMLQGQRDLLTVAQQVLSELAPVMDAQHGTFYMAQRQGDDVSLRLFASYAFAERKHVSNEFHLGEGLVGQAALEKKRIMVNEAPPDYIVIGSSLGSARPLNIAVVPILFEGEVKGVIELASFNRFNPIQTAFIDQLLDSLGIVVATIEATMRTDELLRQSQSMAEELQTQQEELQQTNEELEEKARQLTTQKEEVERKNREVGLAKQELEERAEQLALTSKYKSQFLANMSHELRTPLNSLLILSRQLAENRDENLTTRQVEYSQTIYQAGADLLSLINEILDLAKIESGTMALDIGEVRFQDITDYVERSFQQMAEEKGLAFDVEVDPDLPPTLWTDDMRLRQVLRNLLSNAFKFTDEGGVKLKVGLADAGYRPLQGAVSAGPVVAFSVEDTGIGIPRDKHHVIFEAFQQVDGGTSRRYGGTGLGLSISREIATMLGGELHLRSEPGKGSTFVLYVPLALRASGEAPQRLPSRDARPRQVPPTSSTPTSPGLTAVTHHAVADDRHRIEAGERVLLIIEDDETFAATLLDTARKHGFRGVLAFTGQEALEQARALKPDAITLDLLLPDMDGWVLLDRLKRDPATRHIPVQVISAAGEEHRGREHGAVRVLQKPVDPDALNGALSEIQAFVSRRVKKLLVVEDDTTQRDAIVDLIGNGDVQVVAVGSGADAINALADEQFDCMVLDLNLPDMHGTELIHRIKEQAALRRLPIIVYTGQELSRSDESTLNKLAETIIIKDVRSPERLLDETALFLHRVESALPEPKRKMLRSLAQGDPALKGKKILVVDDDVRNIYALTTVLEQHEVQVVYAENGREALEKVRAEGDIDLVLMDIMMPEMDGYEATRRIRNDLDQKRLPIIALTAKAMKGDRERCVDAGASDYVTKPVDPDQLVSLLRVWLYQ
jgi:CheY-like chemotaxis protein